MPIPLHNSVYTDDASIIESRCFIQQDSDEDVRYECSLELRSVIDRPRVPNSRQQLLCTKGLYSQFVSTPAVLSANIEQHLRAFILDNPHGDIGGSCFKPSGHRSGPSILSSSSHISHEASF